MADEGERLGRLVAALSADAGYAIGARRFPRPVADDDAVAIAAALADEVDEGTAARAGAAAERGLTIACAPGCNACCEVTVMVYRPEALAIAHWLRRPENEAARAAFLAAYPGWRAAVGDAPERLSDAFVAGDAAGYDALLLSTWRKRALCAFNHDGRCAIYPVRPIGCRNAHALDTHALCPPDAPRPPAALAFVPLDRFMHTATRLLRATHNASGGARHRQEAVCASVKRLLDERAG
jgi:uncharacterized protein